MKNNFRLHLTLAMVAFAIFITITVSFINQGKIRDKLVDEHEMKLDMIEDSILSSLHTIDKAYAVFDGGIASEMEADTSELMRLYEDDPYFTDWDLEELKKKFGIDIYIIDTNNIVVKSSVREDVGLNFNICCSSLAALLDDRRKKGGFFHDGLDIEQSSGELKKYSYMATPDKKYLIELGLSLENDPIFHQFNFFRTEAQLEKEHSMVESVKVYNSGGYILGAANKPEEEAFRDSEERLKTFLKANDRKEAQEVEGNRSGEKVIYRYVPYNAMTERGYSTKRIVEIVYSERELNAAVRDSWKEFYIQLGLVLLGAVLVSLFIAHRVGRPMYLAFHDSLTGLKNRVVFEEVTGELLHKKKCRPALMMIDLDNFKLVNDQLGHIAGDHILRAAAQEIKHVAGKRNHAIRLGGDEFVIVYPDGEEASLEWFAAKLIEAMHHRFKSIREKDNIDISISVGIAVADEADDVESLYNKADRALYDSKENGKNQYKMFNMSS